MVRNPDSGTSIPSGAPARGGVCWCVLLVSYAGWRGGGFYGLSSPSSLIRLSDGEGNHFFGNRERLNAKD